jgi:hypothetical protein
MTPTGDDLAGRLGLPAGDPRMDDAIRVAIGILAGRVDRIKAAAYPEIYREGVLQLAVKVWETGTRGMGPVFGSEGEFLIPTQQATAGMWRSVVGIVQPILLNGGVVIG